MTQSMTHGDLESIARDYIGELHARHPDDPVAALHEAMDTRWNHCRAGDTARVYVCSLVIETMLHDDRLPIGAVTWRPAAGTPVRES